MQTQIDTYIENIRKDYVGWNNPKTETERTVRDNMLQEVTFLVSTLLSGQVLVIWTVRKDC